MDAGTAPMINEGVWVALSFIAFVALVWKRAGSALSAMFDKRADDIRKALDEAHQLREEAQAELTKYQKLNREAMQEAEQIVEMAHWEIVLEQSRMMHFRGIITIYGLQIMVTIRQAQEEAGLDKIIVELDTIITAICK